MSFSLSSWERGGGKLRSLLQRAACYNSDYKYDEYTCHSCHDSRKRRPTKGWKCVIRKDIINSGLTLVNKPKIGCHAFQAIRVCRSKRRKKDNQQRDNHTGNDPASSAAPRNGSFTNEIRTGLQNKCQRRNRNQRFTNPYQSMDT